MIKIIPFLLLFFSLVCICVSKEKDIKELIDNSIVRIEVFWTVKNGNLLSIEHSNSLGVLISSEGHVLTCCHSVYSADSLTIVWRDKNGEKSYPARIIDVDKWRDMAIIKPYEKVNFPVTTKIYVKKDLNKESVFYASTDPENPWNTLSSGSLESPVLNDGGREVMGFNMKIYPGSSGSGIFDDEGNLVGIIYAVGTLKEQNSMKDKMALVIPGQSLVFFLERNNVSFLKK